MGRLLKFSAVTIIVINLCSMMIGRLPKNQDIATISVILDVIPKIGDMPHQITISISRLGHSNPSRIAELDIIRETAFKSRIQEGTLKTEGTLPPLIVGLFQSTICFYPIKKSIFL